MGADVGEPFEKMTPSELKQVIEAKAKGEQVHISKELFGWAVACGLIIGTGIGMDNTSLSMAGLLAGGTGLIFSEMYESGEKIVRAGKKLGLKIE